MTNQINAEKPQAVSFVAGTLVHTKEGLRPIEEIKVGDYVLSKAESGEGELAYKRVTRAYEFDDKEIWYIPFSVRENRFKGVPDLDGELFVTGDHPFWVADVEYEHLKAHKNTWVKAEGLRDGMLLLLADGRLVSGGYGNKLICMQFSELAWFHVGNGNQPYEYGQVASFMSSTPQLCKGDIKNAHGEVILRTCNPNSPGDYFNEGEEWEGISEVKWFKRKVYNLEVEDYHTYFVAKQGVRVHAH